MNSILEALGNVVELGKVDKNSPFPPQLKGQDGAYELTQEALDAQVDPKDILEDALIPAMARVGKKFTENKIFVPQMLMSAKAMGASIGFLKPFFQSGAIKAKGTFIIATVAGDLHDIGKNLVSMMVEGGGWQIVDLGVDVAPAKIVEALNEHPDAVVGLSALLTTTMVNMEDAVKEIKAVHKNTCVLVGGAPVSTEFCDKIGADHYSADPHDAVVYLEGLSN